jgi:hypothetical protein
MRSRKPNGLTAILSSLDQFTESRYSSGNVQVSPHQPRSICEVEFQTGTNYNVLEENVLTEAVNTENGSAPNSKQCDYKSDN